MKLALSKATMTTLVLTATALAVQPFGSAQAQEIVAAAPCRAVDYAFADQERDYYAFYAFDRAYTGPADRPACGAAPLRQELAAKQ